MGASARKAENKGTKENNTRYEFISEEVIATSGDYSCEYGHFNVDGKQTGRGGENVYFLEMRNGSKRKVDKFNAEFSKEFGELFEAAAKWMND